MPHPRQPLLLQAARLTDAIYGREETERALAEVHGLTGQEICGIMQQLNANNN